MRRTLWAVVFSVFMVGVVDRQAADAGPLELSVFASGPELVGPPALGAFDLTLLFDPTISVQSLTFGDQLNFGNPPDSFQSFDTSVPGSVNFAEISLVFDLSAQADQFLLATIIFDVASGTLEDALASILVDPGSLGLGDEIGNPLPLSLVQVTSPIPEPTSLLLLGSGVAGFFVRRFRRTI